MLLSLGDRQVCLYHLTSKFSSFKVFGLDLTVEILQVPKFFQKFDTSNK